MLNAPVEDLSGSSLAALGGSSMDAVRIAEMLRSRHRVVVRGIDLLSAVDLTAALRTAAGQTLDREAESEFGPVPGEHVRLTCQQRGVWFRCLLDPSTTQYHFHALFRFDSAPSVPRLRAALLRTVRRHAVLRTRIAASGADAWQVVPPADVSADDLDLSEVELDDPDLSWADLRVAVAADRLFDLATGPLVRWTLVRLAGGATLLLHTEHHLVHDGQSFLALVGTLRGLDLDDPDAPAKPDEPDLRYFRYAATQRPPDPAQPARVAAECATADLSALRPTGAESAGICCREHVPEALLAAVRGTARSVGVTPFVVLFGAFAAAIAHLQNRDRLVVGTGVLNRPPGHDDAVGMYVSLVPVVLDRPGGSGAADYLRAVDGALRDAMRRSDVPLQNVVRELGRTGRGSNTLLSSAFSMHEQVDRRIDLAGTAATVEVGLGNGSAKLPVDAVALASGDSWTGQVEILIEGDAAFVSTADLETLWRRFAAELDALTRSPAAAQVLSSSDAPSW